MDSIELVTSISSCVVRKEQGLKITTITFSAESLVKGFSQNIRVRFRARCLESVIIFTTCIRRRIASTIQWAFLANCNLTKDERQPLKRLKNVKDVCILPADKGRGFTVAMDKKD